MCRCVEQPAYLVGEQDAYLLGRRKMDALTRWLPGPIAGSVIVGTDGHPQDRDAHGMNTMSEMIRSIVRGRNRAAADPQFIAELRLSAGHDRPGPRAMPRVRER